MSFVQFPVSGVIKVPNSSALPTTADQGDVAIAQDTGVTYAFKDGSWLVLASAGVSGANQALSNLASVAINTALLPVTTVAAIDIGSATKVFANVYAKVLKMLGATSGTITIAAPATVTDYSLTMPNAQGGSSTVLTNNGSGVLSWASPAGGANTTLSNLGTTAINVALIPASSLTLGTAANVWTTGYITTLKDSSDFNAIRVESRILTDAAAVTSVSWDERVLKNDSNIATVDYKRSQLVQNTTPIVDWSSPTQLAIGIPMLLPLASADPTGVEGLIYYNTNTHAIRWYNGTTWASLL